MLMCFKSSLSWNIQLGTDFLLSIKNTSFYYLTISLPNIRLFINILNCNERFDLLRFTPIWSYLAYLRRSVMIAFVKCHTSIRNKY